METIWIKVAQEGVWYPISENAMKAGVKCRN